MIDRLLRQQFKPVLDEIEARACVADAFIDKDVYRIFVASVWANVVLDPADIGLTEADIEPLHDVINARAAKIIGDDDAIKECFRFVASAPGELAMEQARLTKTHKDLLLYFSSMILDPHGHKKWIDEVRAERS